MKHIKKMRGRLMILTAVAVALFGCAYGRGLTYTEGGALLGTLYGAGIGAAIGSATGNAGEGAGIGALAGTILGGILGYAIENNGSYGYYDNRYGGSPYYGDPYYRDGYDTGPPSEYGPSYGYGPAPQDRYPAGDMDRYTQGDGGRSGANGTADPEDYSRKQNRRLMSPGYGAR